MDSHNDDCSHIALHRIALPILLPLPLCSRNEKAVVVFLVLPSLRIGNRGRDRVRDDVDLAAALDFSTAPCLLLIRFDSIQFDLIRFTLRRYY